MIAVQMHFLAFLFECSSARGHGRAIRCQRARSGMRAIVAVARGRPLSLKTAALQSPAAIHAPAALGAFLVPEGPHRGFPRAASGKYFDGSGASRGRPDASVGVPGDKRRVDKMHSSINCDAVLVCVRGPSCVSFGVFPRPSYFVFGASLRRLRTLGILG